MPDMLPLRERLALHHWTLETTPLPEFLRVARETGWNAVELRRSSFTGCFGAGMTNAQVVDLIASSNITVAVIGTEYGLFFAKGDEQRRLLKVPEETCANASCSGYLSYEAPNPEQWSRPAQAVAREGVEATRAVLAAIEPR